MQEDRDQHGPANWRHRRPSRAVGTPRRNYRCSPSRPRQTFRGAARPAAAGRTTRQMPTKPGRGQRRRSRAKREGKAGAVMPCRHQDARSWQRLDQLSRQPGLHCGRLVAGFQAGIDDDVNAAVLMVARHGSGGHALGDRPFDQKGPVAADRKRKAPHLGCRLAGGISPVLSCRSAVWPSRNRRLAVVLRDKVGVAGAGGDRPGIVGRRGRATRVEVLSLRRELNARPEERRTRPAPAGGSDGSSG